MMRQLSYIFFLLVLALGSFCFSGNANASTPVNGILASDTTWTASQTPIQLTGPVCVGSGVTLTIEPGVTVNLDQYYIQVNGTLNAQGANDNKIVFTTNGGPPNENVLQRIEFTYPSTAWNEQSNSGCLIDNAIFERLGIFVKGGCSPKISNCIFNSPWWTAIHSRGGSPTISRNTFNGGTVSGIIPAISADCSSIIANNIIHGTTSLDGIIAAGQAYVANNKISRCVTGIKANDQSIIEGNSITSCSNSGIYAISTASLQIEMNYIANNAIGINALNAGLIEYNTVSGNTVGIQCANASIAFNNIVGSTQNSIVLTSSTSIEAPNNWWGTTDTKTINSTIRDYKCDFNLGTVNFTPFLTAANPQAPSNEDTGDFPVPPTPTLIPALIVPPTDTPNEQITSNNQHFPSIDNPSNTSSGFEYANLVIIAVVGIGVAFVVGIVVIFDRRLKKNLKNVP